MMKTFLACVMSLFMGIALCDAAVIVTQAYRMFTIDFDDYDGSGFQPGGGAGTFDSNNIHIEGASDGVLNFGDTKTTGDFARGNSSGGETTGGLWNFTAKGVSTFGVQPSSNDFNGPGTGDFVEFLFENGLGRSVNSLTLQYDIFQHNDQDRSTSVIPYISTDGSNYQQMPGMGMTTLEAADASPKWFVTFQNNNTFMEINDGDSVYVRFVFADAGGSGSRDEIGLANVALLLGSRSVPEPQTAALAGLGILGLRYLRRTRTRLNIFRRRRRTRDNNSGWKRGSKMSKSEY
ncbi:MAG: PEP-CTERM sorting domain-containing protein [Verrucomicrobiota bacterium]